MSPEDPDFYKRLLDHMHDGVYFVDTERRITYWNDGASRLTGYSSQEAVGRHCQDNFLCHVSPEGVPLCTNDCPLTAAIADVSHHEAQVYLRHRDGHRVPVRVRTGPIQDDAGHVVGGVETFSDDTARESAKRRAGELEKLAFLDPLTQVANRRYLETRLEACLDSGALAQSPVGLLVLDIDRFKEINDRYGHDIGDRTLLMVARTLSGLLRPDDLVGRWGGDEFLALILHATPRAIQVVAERCRALVAYTETPHLLGSVHVTVSVGGVMAIPGDTRESLIARADRMMYASKAAGRDRITIE